MNYRLHCTGHPLTCDNRYGTPDALVVTSPEGACAVIKRYAIHAAELKFNHPASGDEMIVCAPLAADDQSECYLVACPKCG